jgi:hypothetical protein
MIRSGELRDRVTIQTDASADGEPTAAYTGTHRRNWPCNITATGGTETFRGKQLETGISYVVEGWYLAGIKADMRLSVTAGLFKGRTINIESVQNQSFSRGQPAKVLLFCKEGDGV